MTDTADNEAVATPIGERTNYVDISGTKRADIIESKWESNTLTLSELKATRKTEIREKGREKASKTDYHIAKAYEFVLRGKTFADDLSSIYAYRDNIRSVVDTAIRDIENATTKDQVKAVTIDWPEPPTEGL